MKPHELQKSLLTWFKSHGRKMAWRRLKKPNPYHVWVSEIMLQQTTVKTVTPYFARFIKKFPTVQSLASSSRKDVLVAWRGLGYYRRAHHLHETAQILLEKYDGCLPQSEQELMALKGIGPYAAAAICSIAFGRRAVVIDGNVMRVLSRFFAYEHIVTTHSAWLKGRASYLTPDKNAGIYAQALMDLGATICTPSKPKCHLCPWKAECLAYKNKSQENFPVRALKKERPQKYAIFFLCHNAKGEILMERRQNASLLRGTMLPPSTPWQSQPWRMQDENSWRSYAPAQKNKWTKLENAVHHVFTHFALHGHLVMAHIHDAPADCVWMKLHAQKEYPLSSLAQKMLTRIKYHEGRVLLSA